MPTLRWWSATVAILLGSALALHCLTGPDTLDVEGYAAHSLVWMPDGNVYYLAKQSDDSESWFGVWRIAADRRSEAQTIDALPFGCEYMRVEGLFVISATQLGVYGWCSDYNSAVYRFDTATGAMEAVLAVPDTHYVGGLLAGTPVGISTRCPDKIVIMAAPDACSMTLSGPGPFAVHGGSVYYVCGTIEICSTDAAFASRGVVAHGFPKPVEFGIAPPGRRLVVATYDGLYVAGVDGGVGTAIREGRYSAVAISPDGTRAVVAEEYGGRLFGLERFVVLKLPD